jgi:hypothetical protein
MTNNPFSISVKNSPKQGFFSPKSIDKYSYILVLQWCTNSTTFSKQHNGFSKDAMRLVRFNSLYLNLNSPYFIKSGEFITRNF